MGIPWSFIGAPDSFLINGRGIYYCQQVGGLTISPNLSITNSSLLFNSNFQYQCIYPNNPSKCGVCNRSNPHCNPLSTFVVESNKTYRFRLSNLALWGQMNFAIEVCCQSFKLLTLKELQNAKISLKHRVILSPWSWPMDIM